MSCWRKTYAGLHDSTAGMVGLAATLLLEESELQTLVKQCGEAQLGRIPWADVLRSVEEILAGRAAVRRLETVAGMPSKPRRGKPPAAREG